MRARFGEGRVDLEARAAVGRVAVDELKIEKGVGLEEVRGREGCK